MNWLDIALIAVFIVRTFWGWKQRIVKGALLLASSILAVTLAGIFYRSLAQIFGFIPIEYAANVTAFVLILTCVEILTGIPIRFLSPALSALIPRVVNNIGGGLFGFLMAVVELTALLAIWLKYFPSTLVTESLISGILLDKAPLILNILPSEFSAVRDFFR